MRSVRLARPVLSALSSLSALAALAGLAGLLALGGCGAPIDDPHSRVPTAPTGSAALPTLAGGAAPAGPLAVTHGGAGAPPEWSPGCQAAAEKALAALRGGAAALDGAVAGTMVMEDDPRFNAGTGANIRLDGRTIQMDAAVMTSEGRFGAVAVIEHVRNPVAVARAMLDTPHLLLAGEGATRFARAAGFADVTPRCDKAEADYQRRIASLLAGQDETFGRFDWRRYWNFPNPIPPELGGGEAGGGAEAPDHRPGDTVGTVARDAQGRFAATLSTGGTSLTLYGRVGDVPIYGAGLFAGPAGAVACTGWGEAIIRRAAARAAYALLEQGVPTREAARQVCARFKPEEGFGIITIGRDGWGVASNLTMAHGHAGGE